MKKVKLAAMLVSAAFITVLSIGDKDNNCQCRSYQIDTHMDTVTVYDGGRIVGRYITTWTSQIDSIILKDNE